MSAPYIPFLSVATFLKHPDFVEENKYRIVALCYRTNSQSGRQSKLNSASTLVGQSYHMGSSLPIKSVVVGPHPQQQDQMRAIEMLLEQHNVKADVRISQTPFGVSCRLSVGTLH